MAVNGTHNTGEEFKQKSIYRQDNIGTRPGSVDVLLYDDSSDSLTESDDVGSISSEPTSGNYSRQSISLDSTDLSVSQSSGDIVIEATVTFDVSDTGETVDGFAVVVNFQSDIVSGDTSANDHLLLSGTFGTTDLTNYTSIDVTLSDTLS